jgi:ABC-type amino acid transport substrate-binding protein
MNKVSMSITAILLSLSIVAGCASKTAPTNAGAASSVPSASPSTSQSTTQTPAPENPYKKAGKIVLGTSADYAPYEFHKSINGKDTIIGFDIEIAKAIAKDLGVELEIKDMKFDGLLAALQAGNIDMVIAGMTPDDERKKSVDFSKIYYKAQQGIMVRTDEKDKYKTMDDLKKVRVGVQKGSTQEKIANEQLQGATIKALGKIPDLVLELKNKKADALIVELPVAAAYVSKNPDISIAQAAPKADDGGSAVALKKGNTFLVQQIDKTLDKLIADKSVDKFVADANEQVE